MAAVVCSTFLRTASNRCSPTLPVLAISSRTAEVAFCAETKALMNSPCTSLEIVENCLAAAPRGLASSSLAETICLIRETSSWLKIEKFRPLEDLNALSSFWNGVKILSNDLPASLVACSIVRFSPAPYL